MNTKNHFFTKLIVGIAFALSTAIPLYTYATGGGGGRAPIVQPAPPQDFSCGWVPVTYVERLEGPNLEGVNMSITSQGIHRIAGRTTSGSHSCKAIRAAISNKNSSAGYDTNAYPSQITVEEVRRVSWAFNPITLVRDNGNSKSSSSRSMEAPSQGARLQGIVNGQTYNTVMQSGSPYQERYGGVFNYGINTINDTGRPTFLSGMYTVPQSSVTIGNSYDFSYTNQSRTRPCFSTGPSWQECHHVFSFRYDANLPVPTFIDPTDPDVGIQITHADNPGAPLYPNSPIRAQWKAKNATSGQCSMITSPNVAELTFANVPYAPITTRVVRPQDGIGQFLEDVNQQGNFVERLTRNPLLAPRNYVANVSCLLSNDSGPDRFDDVFRTNARGTGPQLISDTTEFEINSDRVVTLTVTQTPPTIDDNNPTARIIARTTNAQAGDIHRYSIPNLPNGYKLADTSSNAQTITVDDTGESGVAWDIEVITSGPNRANIGNVEVVAQMIDNFDNLYAGTARFTYFGGRGLQEIQP